MIRLRLQGFTIIELLVALSISLLVITLAYSVINMLYANYHAIRKSQEEVNRLSDMEFALSTDIERAYRITCSEEFIVFRNSEQEIKYEIFPERVVRYVNDFAADTFACENVSFEYRFKNKLVVAGIVDQLDYNVNLAGQVFHFRKLKWYSAEQLLGFINNEKDSLE